MGTLLELRKVSVSFTHYSVQTIPRLRVLSHQSFCLLTILQFSWAFDGHVTGTPVPEFSGWIGWGWAQLGSWGGRASSFPQGPCSQVARILPQLLGASRSAKAETAKP